MAGGNRGLLSSLGVNDSHPFFNNPLDETRAVWCLSEVPHALKLLRNHFLDHGFILPSGTAISKDTVRDLMNVDGPELKIAHKLTPLHVNVSGMERQKVRLAAQLFSGTTAAAIRSKWPDKQEMANFFQLVNDAFDVLNSRIKTGKLPHQSAYGLALDAQDHVLDAMSVMLANTHAIGKKILLPFQKGFLLSIAATKGLFNDIRSRFGAHYFMTTRLNQDCLENFFSQVRGLGHHHDHPTTRHRST